MSEPLVAVAAKHPRRIPWFFVPLSASAVRNGYLPVPASEHRRFYLRRNYLVTLAGPHGRRYDCFLQRYGRRKTRVQIDRMGSLYEDWACRPGDAALLGVLDKKAGVYLVRKLPGSKGIEWSAPEVKCITREEVRYGFAALDALRKPRGRGRRWVMNALLVGKSGEKEHTHLILERIRAEKRPVYYLTGLRDWFWQERAVPNDVLVAQVSRDRRRMTVHLADGAEL